VDEAVGPVVSSGGTIQQLIPSTQRSTTVEARGIDAVVRPTAHRPRESESVFFFFFVSSFLYSTYIHRAWQRK